MRKTILSIIICGALVACSGESKKSTEEQPQQTAARDLSSNPDYTKGLELMGKSDCQTCHKVNETVIGPSFSSIAAKYPDNEATIDTLATKIIKGGSGNWGNVPMAAHSNISVEDAKAMVKYILLLKNP